ncbi:MAG TPA: alpha/beta hydrolase [Acidimicrobiales bacterium]|nr:alpha/beta hydrolase [Acidimicrobiales bacterium]
MAIADALGAERLVELESGPVRYRERGAGRPVVFVHGLLANGLLWRQAVPALARATDGLWAITPDWPFGSHSAPMGPGADLSPPGMASLIAGFLEALDLTDVVLVANDTGGAFVQGVLADHPERVAGAVLATCDAYERFLPPPFHVLSSVARAPGSMWALCQALRSRTVQRSPLAYGWLTKRPIPEEVVDSFLAPSRRDRAIRRDLAKMLRHIDRRYTLKVVDRLQRCDRPVLLAWAAEDKLFPLSLAERMVAQVPSAWLVPVSGSRTFVPEDQPDTLAELVADFVAGLAPGHAAHQSG